jgi:N-acetylmuramoyl-L-alanine amidase
MPSVLVETGYITNRAEEDYLNSKEGQLEIANCVKNAFKEYIGWLSKQQNASGNQTKIRASPNKKEVYTFLQTVDKEERKRIEQTK